MAIWSIELRRPAARGWISVRCPVGRCMSSSVLIRPLTVRSPRLPGTRACMAMPSDERSKDRLMLGLSMYRAISGKAVVSYRWQSQSTTGTSKSPRRSASLRALARKEKRRSGITFACGIPSIAFVIAAPSHVEHRRQLEAGHVAGAQHLRCCDYHLVGGGCSRRERWYTGVPVGRIGACECREEPAAGVGGQRCAMALLHQVEEPAARLLDRVRP